MLKARPVRSVSKRTSEGMHRIARKRDIDKGELYDSRSEAVDICCSPEDRPAGYSYKTRRGAPNCPRDYIATVMPREESSEGDGVRPELRVDPERGGAVPLGSRTEPTEEEVKWAREKFDELVNTGGEEGVFEEVLICPFCGEGVEADAFNNFVKHATNHTEVSSVEMKAEGNVLHLVDGRTLSPLRLHSREGEKVRGELPSIVLREPAVCSSLYIVKEISTGGEKP